MTLGQNSDIPEFEGGSAESAKNCLFLNQSIKNQDLCNISKNQSPKSVRRGDMEEFSHFRP